MIINKISKLNLGPDTMSSATETRMQVIIELYHRYFTYAFSLFTAYIEQISGEGWLLCKKLARPKHVFSRHSMLVCVLNVYLQGYVASAT